MQTFRFAKVTRYHVGNHYKIVYLYFSVFQLVITNCFSIYIYIISSYFKFVERFRLKLKKKCTSSLKNMPYNFLKIIYIFEKIIIFNYEQLINRQKK